MATAGIISTSDEAQLTQTIEMFEVITQSQPQDYQSLEILREAYVKLGRDQDVIKTSKRIANAYVLMGQLSSAILEYESILQKHPEDPDATAALSEIETKARGLNSNASPTGASDTTESSAPPSKPAPKTRSGNTTHTRRKPLNPDDVEDGRKHLYKLFVDSKLVAASDFDACWPAQDYSVAPAKIVEPFLQKLADKGVLPFEKALKVILDKHRIAFLPIDRYEVDVELSRTFPQSCLKRWCVMPFDRMSKSILVATANPFNKQAAAELQDATNQRLIWYLVHPIELVKVLTKVVR